MNIAERASASSQAPETVRATLVLDKAFEDLEDEYALVYLAFLPIAILQAAVAFCADMMAVHCRGSAAWREFETAFATDVASVLGIDASRVVIASITPGSVIVVFDVMPADNSDAAGMSLADVEAAFQGSITLPTVGAQADLEAEDDAVPQSGLSAPALAQASAARGGFGPLLVVPACLAMLMTV